VVQDGRVTTLDERALRAEARALAREAMGDAAAAEAAAAQIEPHYAAMLRRSHAHPVAMRRRLDP
jgi:hypothetical protein